jgi:hypothetical protein
MLNHRAVVGPVGERVAAVGCRRNGVCGVPAVNVPLPLTVPPALGEALSAIV